ncbi:hypothetical protein HAHE_18190 [Haloferula helveola]|uniref:Autotransporter-associated beta strand repeat-containing protein n=1 Tax=Haloferula helveola TaxID=490095 RepID=A0ABN6H2Q5_9BACT|nr:hypothetical protein HAHE_18190 [Haloferula helveola]
MRFFLIITVLLGMPAASLAEAEADLLVAFDNSYTDGVGGDENAKVLTANAVAASNYINQVSGSPARMRVCGYHKTWWQGNRSTLGGYVNWLNNYGDSELNDVTSAADAAGADLVAYICQGTDTGIAAVAQQPGRYAAYQPNSFWNNIVAHESGGHNYGLDHRVGRADPKTIMLHNYCGGGSQGYFSNPNIWLNGVQLIGEGSCLGTALQGGDAVANLSNAAQGVADRRERVVWGSYRGAITHRWQFNQAAGAAPAGTSIGGTGGTAYVRGNGATFTGTALRLPGGTTGNAAGSSIAAYIDLPNGMFSGMPNWTLEIWATPLSGKTWMRVVDIGRPAEAGDGTGAAGEYTPTASSPAPGVTSGSDQIGLSAAMGGASLNNQRLITGVNGTYQTDDSNLGTTAGEIHHYAITFGGGTIKWYRDGTLIKTRSVSFSSADLEDVNNWLGRSLWSNDQMAHMDYHDVRVQSLALNDRQVAANYLMGPNDSVVTLWANDPFGSSGFVNGSWEYGQSTPNPTQDYEIGELTLRTPANSSNNSFPGKSLAITGGGTMLIKSTAARTTTVNDLRLAGSTISNAGSGTQTLAGNITMATATENYIRGANGDLVISANISGGVGGGGMHYSENTITLTGDNSGYHGATIIGDGRATKLRISDETNLGGNPTFKGGAWLQFNRGTLETTQTLTLDDPNRGIFFDVNGGTFNVTTGTLTIDCELTGPSVTAGSLAKQGPGSLILNSPSSTFNGVVYVDSGSTTANDGILLVTTTEALSGARSPIYIRNNNGGSSTLELAGDITLNKWIDLSGRNNSVPSIRNISGNNTMQGVLLQAGGGDYRIQSDSGLLTMTTVLQSAAGGTRTLTFQGDGDVTLTSAIQNGSADQINVVKTGAGTLTLGGACTHTGSVTVSGGTLFANPGNGATNRAMSYVSGITVNDGAILKAGPNGLFGWNGTQTKPITVNAGGLLTTDASDTDVNVGTVTLAGGTLAGGPSTAWGSWNFKRVAGAKLRVTADSSVTALNVGLGTGNAIDIDPGRTLTFSGSITDLSSEGTCALTKNGGSGTLVLSGTNTYTGPTLLDTGTTLVNGSLGNTTVTVASAATLGGTGTIAGPVTINGTHSPGASAGEQDFGGTLDYGAASVLKWELTANSVSPGSFDQVSASGAVTIASGAALDVSFNAPGSGVAFDDIFWTQVRSWTVLTGSSVSGSFTLGAVSNDPGGRILTDYGTLALQQDATSVTLVFTPDITPTEAWRQANFGVDWDNLAVSGDDIDVEKDGNVNVIEYATGTDPNLANGSPVQGTTAGGKLKISFNRNTAATDLILIVTVSDGLDGGWTEIARSENGAAFVATDPSALVSETGTGDIRAVEVTDVVTVNDPAHPKRFMRLKVLR